ncbi:MAG: recombinase RecT [Verrucomicrobiota bacterium]
MSNSTQIESTNNESGKFDLLQRQAKAFSSSELVPQRFQGKHANCIVALEIADRLKASPLAVMQNLYIVHGQPAFSSTFCIATVNTCGRFSPLKFVFEGKAGDDDYGCYAVAKEKDSGDELKGEKITWSMVKAEGWDTKKGSKWKTMPGQMFRYRAASFWTRAYAPEFLMGMQTNDEIIDVEPVNVTGSIASEVLPLAKADEAELEDLGAEFVLQEDAKEDAQ